MMRRLCEYTLVSLIVLTVPTISASAESIRVPDDHPTIQDAIDAAATGDVILVSAGTYRERIRMKDHVTLRSVGDDTEGQHGLSRAEATIIDGGGADGDRAGVTMAEGSTLDGFTVTNVGSYDDARWKKHHATRGDDQSHEHIGMPGTAGIEVTGVNCSVTHNVVHHIGYTGIAIQCADGKLCSPHIYRNVCFRNMGGGIGSMMKSTAIIEENICFENFYAGIGHDDASPLVINNRCYGNIRAGIGISHGASPVVRGNKCYSNRRAGIGSRTGGNTRPIIEDNDCYENEMAGIGCEEEAAPLIRNNRCYKNRLAGIGSRTGATPTIVGNECYENEQAGIGQASNAMTLLVDNHCHHNKTAGIGFDSCTAGSSTVTNNRVIDNALVAVGIHEGWSVRLSSNKLSRQGGLPPIAMVFEGAEAVFTDNVIRGGGVAGIRVGGKVRAEHNQFVGTEMRPAGPPNFGVWALPGSTVIMTGNKISSWRHGLYAQGSAVTAARNTISGFLNRALVIQNASEPVHVFGNTAISPDHKDQALSLVNSEGVVHDNKRRQASE